jgi:exopolyphosphatase/guanosine-5'-triphosphate,3'-diphosphate pyrophosphatase
VGDVLLAAGWPAGAITQEGLDWILERLISAQSADRVRLAGMREDRKSIIGGGVAVMRAVFKLLGIRTMQQASGGLRHGLICDLLGGAHSTGDMRAKTVARLAAKFNVDTVHGARVSKVATFLMAKILEVPHGWQQDPQRLMQKLSWAAELHEIGSHISHSDYHKHGAYILDNADAMGFSLSEMHRLSLLVLGHRGKLRKVEAVLEDHELGAQLMALRIGIILCHARRDPDLSGMTLRAVEGGGNHWVFACRDGWTAEYPQSAHLMREEVLAWQKTPWTLELHCN